MPLNKKQILDYLLRSESPATYAFKVSEDTEGNQTVDYFFSANRTEPSDTEMTAVEADALNWSNSQRVMTYDALFKLLPRTLRARSNALKDDLKADTDLAKKEMGYMLEELLRDVAKGDVLFNASDPIQAAEFEGVRSLLVGYGILSAEQADTWGQLEVVA